MIITTSRNEFEVDIERRSIRHVGGEQPPVKYFGASETKRHHKTNEIIATEGPWRHFLALQIGGIGEPLLIVWPNGEVTGTAPLTAEVMYPFGVAD